MCTYILIVNVLAFDFGAIYTVYTGIYEYIQYIQYCTGIDVFHLSNVIVDRDTAVRKNVGGGDDLLRNDGTVPGRTQSL